MTSERNQGWPSPPPGVCRRGRRASIRPHDRHWRDRHSGVITAVAGGTMSDRSLPGISSPPPTCRPRAAIAGRRRSAPVTRSRPRPARQPRRLRREEGTASLSVSHFIRRAEVHEPVDDPDEDGSTDDVAERRRREVPEEPPDREARRVRRGCQTGIALQREPHRDEVHVGHGVLEPVGDERGDRRHDSDHLVRQRASAGREPDGETNQSIREDPPGRRPSRKARRSFRRRSTTRSIQPPCRRASTSPPTSPSRRSTARRRSCQRRRSATCGATVPP